MTQTARQFAHSPHLALERLEVTPGTRRRVFVLTAHSLRAHLPKRRAVRTGPVAYCGLVGREAGWAEVRELVPCRVCFRLVDDAKRGRYRDGRPG